jgi:hypothetical protein
LKEFFKDHLGWRAQLKEELDGPALLELFRQQVILPANSWIENADFLPKRKE